MFLSSSTESTTNHEAEHAEGSLFLCESDLLSALLFSGALTSLQPAAALAQDAAAVLLSLNGQMAVAAC